MWFYYDFLSINFLGFYNLIKKFKFILKLKFDNNLFGKFIV